MSKHIGVLHFTPCTSGTTMASARIAQFIRDETSGILIDCKKNFVNIRFETLFIVNSPFAFCDFKREAVDIAAHAGCVVWIQNDFAIDIPNSIETHVDEVWSSVEGKDKYIDWNRLTFNETEFLKRPRDEFIYNGIFYWGAFRKERAQTFEKYFNTDMYKVSISTTETNRHLFRAAAFNNKNLILYEQITRFSVINKFKATIYLEDKTSHLLFCSLANRFYEALSHGIPIFIDKDCLETFKRAKLKVDPGWVVSSPSELELMLDTVSTTDMIIDQKRRWGKNYFEELRSDFCDLFTTMKR